MKVTVVDNFPQAAAMLKRYEQDVLQKATRSAINKTLAQAKTQMAREIVSEFAVSSAYVKQRLRVRTSSAKMGAYRIEGALIGGDGKRRSANLIAFLERVVTIAELKRRAKAGTRNQLFFKIKRRGAAKPIKGAFIGNKGRTVFVRTDGTMKSRAGSKGTKHRQAIESLRTIDVSQMFNTRRINLKVQAFIRGNFKRIFAHEVRFFSGGRSGAAKYGAAGG